MLTIFISSGARPAICSADHSANNFSYPIQGNVAAESRPELNLSDAEFLPSLCVVAGVINNQGGFIEQEAA
jgi:hypothetical protein